MWQTFSFADHNLIAVDRGEKRERDRDSHGECVNAKSISMC